MQHVSDFIVNFLLKLKEEEFENRLRVAYAVMLKLADIVLVTDALSYLLRAVVGF